MSSLVLPRVSLGSSRKSCAYQGSIASVFAGAGHIAGSRMLAHEKERCRKDVFALHS